MSRSNGVADGRFDAAGFEVPFAASFEDEALSDSEATFEAESESPFAESTFEAQRFEAEDFDSESVTEAGAWSEAEGEAETESEGEAENAGGDQLGYDETLAWLDVEAADSSAEDEEESESPLSEAEDESLSAEQRAWILALDRTAIERLPDSEARARFLQQDWSDVEFPGNVPKGQVATAEIRRHWALARSLFDAMAGVVPERRVPTTIRFRDRPVVRVPGQPTHRLFGEARDAFVRMREAAMADGVELVIVSSWRSRARQAAASANQPNPAAVARGVSAHMYGLAIDLRMSVPGLPVKETNTRVDRVAAARVGTAAKMGNLVRMYRSPVYKWMLLRASEFGWFPYRNEPWHWEYNPPGLKERFEGATRSELEQEGWPEAEYEEESETPSPSLRTFTAKALGVKVAVYVTQAARNATQVELMVFAHGLDLCPPVMKDRPATFITERPFKLGELVEATGRPIVLVVPFLDWERLDANRMAFGRRWHRLAQAATFNQVAAEALEQARAITGSAAPAKVQRLILAGHSRAYGFFDALAHQHASPDMRTGALSQPTHVWALDTTYSAPIADWRAWLRSREDLHATVVFRHGKYRSKGSTVVRELATGVRGREFAKLATASDSRLTAIPVAAGKVGHCAIPAKYLPDLLAALPALTTSGEDESEALETLESEGEQLGYDETLAWLDVEALTGEAAAEAQEEEEESEAEAEGEWGAESDSQDEAESYDESESESEAEAALSESERGEAEEEAEEEEEFEDFASEESDPELERDSPGAKCPNLPTGKDKVTCSAEPQAKARLCKPGGNLVCKSIPELWVSKTIEEVPFYYGAVVRTVEGTGGKRKEFVRAENMNYTVRLTLAAWKAAQRWITSMSVFGMPIAAVITAGAGPYCRCIKTPKGVCRHNNPGGCTGTKLSNHGDGDAIDITGVMWKDPDSVGSTLKVTLMHSWRDAADQAPLLVRINAALRLSFATVLDYTLSDHQDHFHVDTHNGVARNVFSLGTERWFLAGCLRSLGYIQRYNKPPTWADVQPGLAAFARQANIALPTANDMNAWRAIVARVYGCIALGSPAHCHRS